MKQKVALIIGAGPAGLTAALELLEKTNIHPIILEASENTGGISKTVEYKGNRIDIGGHRFFSKSDRVMKWWTSILPIQGKAAKDYISLKREVYTSDIEDSPDPELTDEVMLVRNRLSRIYYMNNFFDYPVSLNIKTVMNLGLFRIFKIGLSYMFSRIRFKKKEETLEDFFINRFGKELFKTFFKDYTEKVWGVPCNKISSEWGAQRIKGLSLIKTLVHAMKSIFTVKSQSIEGKNTETSLIEQFFYPKYGPGQLWQLTAQKIIKKGGEIRFNQKVSGINTHGNGIQSVNTIDSNTNSQSEIEGDYVFSSMPVKDLINSFNDSVSSDIVRVANGLVYRDFITIGVLLKKMKLKNETAIRTINGIIPDNWIYIQDKEVTVGRLQIFNNWSPYMVSDDQNVWIGLEYFCNEGDWLWNKSDIDIIDYATQELEKIGIADRIDMIDSNVIRIPKAYPAYFGTYSEFDKIRLYTDQIPNLFLIGRNGMHRYNNMDHSMLTAMTAVENIINGVQSKDNIWAVNSEEDYHENKASE